MSVEENKTIVRRFNEEAFNKGNLAIMDEVFAPNYVAYFPGSPPMDREGHKQFNAGARAAFPDSRATIEDLIAEGDKVAYRWTASGSHQGEFQGIPATGKQFTMTGMTILRIVDGKIVESWHNYDSMGMLQQLGVVPPPR